ncbi:hypothetical protein [Nocardia nepalensis]|uniref:hypothetical protein n=1 Tax=Nocardia nepalensis TaxID=3375448 RepID=UPI003B676C46
MTAGAASGVALHDWRTHALGAPDWDPAHWSPRVLLRRCRSWIAATRRRRWTAWILLAVFVLFVFPGVVNAIATAQSGTDTAGSSVNSATSWMNIRDSSGVPLSNYTFVTNHGSVFNPGYAVISLMIFLIFEPWIIIETSANWMVGNAFSFEWLNLIGKPVQAAAENLSRTVATPLLATVAVAIGGIPLAVFIIRGYHAKAAMGVLFIGGVVVLSPLFLDHPVEDVISSNGFLAQGRNLGISVAAGLNGNSNPDTTQLVATLQEGMADNFVRAPLQVWNYGHVVDQRPACKAAWSAGMMAGSEDQVKSGLRSCGDTAAYAATEKPSWWQVGAGFIIIVSGGVTVVFCVYMSCRVVLFGMDAMYYSVLAIFGFGAGGYIYGATQTWTIRCVVHAVYSGFWMVFNIIFLAIYMLILNGLFEAVGG